MGKLGVGAGLPFVTCSKPTPIRWVPHPLGVVFGGFGWVCLMGLRFFLSLLSPQKPKTTTLPLLFTPRKIFYYQPNPQSATQWLPPSQDSTLKRRQNDTTSQQKCKHPEHDIPCKKLKPAQPHTVNQQGQMSVEEVQDDMPGSHSLMHPNIVRDAANGGDKLEIVDNDSQPVAPLEDVETAEEERSE